MPTYQCWKCDERFPTPRERKNHLSSGRHNVLQIICPFYDEEEKVLKRSNPELKDHMKRYHKQELRDLKVADKDFFSEANGYWLAVHPRDYGQLVHPTLYTSDPAKAARKFVRDWLKRRGGDNMQRTLAEWESGWKTQKKVPRSSSLESESNFLPIYEDGQPPAKKYREASPASRKSSKSTRNEYDLYCPEVEIGKLHIQSINIGAEMSATFWADGTPMVWYRIVIDPGLTSDQRAMTSFCRRLGKCDAAGVTPPSDMRRYADKRGHLRKATAKELGVDQSFVKETFIGRSLEFEVYPVNRKARTAPTATVTSASSAAPAPSTSKQPTPPVTAPSAMMTFASISTPAATTVTSAPSVSTQVVSEPSTPVTAVPALSHATTVTSAPSVSTQVVSEPSTPVTAVPVTLAPSTEGTSVSATASLSVDATSCNQDPRSSSSTDASALIAPPIVSAPVCTESAPSEIPASTSEPLGSFSPGPSASPDHAASSSPAPTPGLDIPTVRASSTALIDVMPSTTITSVSSLLTVPLSSTFLPIRSFTPTAMRTSTPAKTYSPSIRLVSPNSSICSSRSVSPVASIGLAPVSSLFRPQATNAKPSQDVREILAWGGMPLFPPARRNCERTVVFKLPAEELQWPPQNWAQMSPDQRLLHWEFTAMTLERASGDETSSRGELLDKFNFLALPDTKVPPYDTAVRKARYYVYETLRQSSDESFKRQIRSAMMVRDTSVDRYIKIVNENGISLRL